MIAAFLLALAAQPAPVSPVAASASVVAAPSPSLEALRQQLQSVAAGARGDFGIAVLDPTSGRSIAVNGDRPFPMASTVKVAIAATYLADVDAGRRTLNDLVPVDERLRLRADSSAAVTPYGGTALSAANLIELMITRSDNTATDVLLHHLGGPRVVQQWLNRNRLTGLRVDRSIAQLLLARKGIGAPNPTSAAMILRRYEPVDSGVSGVAVNDNQPLSPTFDADPRDSATPVAFAELLRRLHDTELLKPASRDFLLDAMRRCITGANRIKGLLPKGTPVEHKTGTYSTITDDVGFVSLPDGRRIIIAAFARGGANRSALIARASRLVYDAFAFAR